MKERQKDSWNREAEVCRILARAADDSKVHIAIRNRLISAFHGRETYKASIRENVPLRGQDWPQIVVGFAYKNSRVTAANTISLDIRSEKRAVDKVKVLEANCMDLLETGRFDPEHIITILHAPSSFNWDLGKQAERVLAKVSTVYTDNSESLDTLISHIAREAEPWSDSVLTA